MGEDRSLPDPGEIVVCTVREITSHGIYVNLDQYDGTNGFLHVSEISTGWVRNIDRVAKVSQKLILKVIRVHRRRRRREQEAVVYTHWRAERINLLGVPHSRRPTMHRGR